MEAPGNISDKEEERRYGHTTNDPALKVAKSEKEARQKAKQASKEYAQTRKS